MHGFYKCRGRLGKRIKATEMEDHNFSVAELTEKFSTLCKEPVGMQYKGQTLLTDKDVQNALDDCYSQKKLFLEVDLIVGASSATQQAIKKTPAPAAAAPRAAAPKPAPISIPKQAEQQKQQTVAPGVDQTASQMLAKLGLSPREKSATTDSKPAKQTSPRRVAASVPSPAPKQTSPRRVAPSSSSSASLRGGLDAELRAAVNRLRSQPQSYVSLLEERKGCFEGSTMRLKRGAVTFRSQTHEGPAAVAEAAQLLRSARPVSELRFCAGLSEAAREIVDFMGPEGNRKPSPEDMNRMIERHGEYEGTLSQVIAYIYEDDVLATIMDLIVCDGDKTRHTAGLLRNADYKFGGLAISSPDKGPCLVVLQFVTEEWQDK